MLNLKLKNDFFSNQIVLITISMSHRFSETDTSYLGEGIVYPLGNGSMYTIKDGNAVIDFIIEYDECYELGGECDEVIMKYVQIHLNGIKYRIYDDYNLNKFNISEKTKNNIGIWTSLE